MKFVENFGKGCLDEGSIPSTSTKSVFAAWALSINHVPTNVPAIGSESERLPKTDRAESKCGSMIIRLGLSRAQSPGDSPIRVPQPVNMRRSPISRLLLLILLGKGVCENNM